MMTEFFMAMIPPTATHQERGCVIKDGRHRYYGRNSSDAEAKLTAYLAQHVPPEPYTGAVRVVTKWCFPIRGRHCDGEPYTSKPDVDNLCKSLYDIMTRLKYWKDDRLIVSAVTEKFWAECPGIYIRIEEV